MWILDNPDLPTVAEDPNIGIAIAQIDTGVGAIALCELDFPPINAIAIPEFSGDSFSVELPQAEDIESVAGFTRAIDPVAPKAGEFVWDRVTQQLVVYPAPGQATPGLKLGVVGLSIDGGTRIVSLSGVVLPPVEKVPTSWVNPNLFSAFWGLPVTGTINWTRSLEQHPSGSISLLVLQSGIAMVRSRFAKGKELEFAGIGFSVAGYTEKLLSTHEYPGGVYDVSVSLTGKWNRPAYLKPVYLRGITKSSASYTSPASLAAQNKVNLQTAGNGNNWKITIARDTPKNVTANWLSLATERARQNGTFLVWSDPNAVKFSQINSTNNWSYWLPEIEIASQGDWASGDGRFGYAVEYANLTLTGEFSEDETNDAEDTQGKSRADAEPRWRKREPMRLEYVNGDPRLDEPPENTTVLTDLSLNFDTSGPTKSQEKTKTEDGILVERKVTVYGFVYLGRDIYQGENELGKRVYRDEAAPYWQVIKEETETFHFDEDTGYLLGSTKIGWQLVRFATESNSDFPETVLADESDDEIEINRAKIYQFRKAPIDGATAYYLEQHLDYYNDVETPPVITYEFVDFSGNVNYSYVIDPTYVPSMFVSAEMQHTNTFLWMPHPDNDSELAKSEDYIPKPDLTTGEETLNRRYLKILPSSNTEGNVATFLGDGSDKIGDRFVEYSSQFCASGPDFKNIAEDTKTTTNNGRPGVATRKPSLLERVEPGKKKPSSPKYEYRLLTPGYKTTDMVGGSISFPYAKTQNIAMLAAKTDLQIRDAQESANGSIAVPFNHLIKEFDTVDARTKFDSYNLRVIGAANSVTIQGQLNGIPEVRADTGTKLTVGINRQIAIRIEKIKSPDNKLPNNLAIFKVITKDITLGSLLPNTVMTRRNRK